MRSASGTSVCGTGAIRLRTAGLTRAPLPEPAPRQSLKSRRSSRPAAACRRTEPHPILRTLRFLGYYSGSQDYFTHRDMGLDLHLDEGANCGAGCSKSVAEQYDGNYSTEIFAARAEEVIGAHDPATPLFLYLAWQAVHAPIEAPEHYVAPYAHLDPNRRVFAGMVAAMDEGVGRVRAALQARSNMWKDTLLIFSTDKRPRESRARHRPRARTAPMCPRAGVPPPACPPRADRRTDPARLLDWQRRSGGQRQRPPARDRRRDGLAELAAAGREGRIL